MPPDAFVKFRLGRPAVMERYMLHRTRFTSTFAALLCTFLYTLAPASHAAEPVVRPAVDGILEAFATHPLVGLGEFHMLANELNFYIHPRSASTSTRQASGRCTCGTFLASRNP